MRSYLRSFAGGEVDPEFFGRGDEVTFQTGLALCLNFITLPHGPVRNRPGTQWLANTKNNGVARWLPFTFSTTQTFAIEFGVGYFRFFSNGVPVMAVDGGAIPAFNFVKQITNVQISPTDTVDTTTNHLLTTGDEIMLGAGQGGVEPTGLGAFTVYYAIVVDANTIRFATTLANALAGTAVTISATGSGPVFICRVYRKGTLIANAGNSYYCSVESSKGWVPDVIIPQTSSMSAATNQITSVNHGTFKGSAITIRANGGTLPPELVDGGTYYAIPLTANTFQVAATFGSLTPIDFSVDSSGSPTWEPFDHWLLQQDGIYEIPHPYTEPQLFFVDHFQSNDVVTLLHRSHAPRTLRRFGTVDWRLVDENYAPKVPRPLGLADGLEVQITSTGAVIEVVSVALGPPLVINSNVDLPLATGQTVYGSIDMTGTHLPPGFYRVGQVTGASAQLVFISGQNITLTGTLISGGFRVAQLGTENTNTYVVTAVDDKGNESLPTEEVSNIQINNLFVTGSYNTIVAPGVVGSPAIKHRFYKKLNGAFGFIGESMPAGTNFKDDNIAPDLSKQPPRFDTTMNVSPFPEAGCYHEQRKVLGRDQLVWMTRPGTETDLTFNIPIKEDDRINFGIAATEFSQIKHFVSMESLIVLTSAAEFVVGPHDSAVLTPLSLRVHPESFIGSSHVKPLVVNRTGIFCAARGGHLRAFAHENQQLATSDLSLRAAHLFDNLTIVDQCYSKAPYPIVWAVSSNGKLLGLTFVPEQQVAGWHQHTLGGADAVVESCVAIAEGNEDRLYLVVRRTVNALTVRHLVRMATFRPTNVVDSFFVDSGRSIAGPVGPGQLGGFLHLRGKEVAILADGIVLPRQTVNSAGEITLSTTYTTKVTVGLPIDAQIQTLPLFMQLDGAAQGQRKVVSEVHARVVQSAPFFAGPSLSLLVPSNNQAPSVRGLAIAETLVPQARIPVLPKGDWTEDAQLFLQHRLPLPLTVISLTLKVAV